jgi:hypothetical protein
MSLPDIRARILLCVLTGYILFNYGFMQLRLPPGIPLSEICLIFCLATINIPVVLRRMSGAINLAPLLTWWCFGLGRAIVDGSNYGVWALRDAVQVIESLWLIVAFAVVQKAENLETLCRWLKWLGIAYLVYAVGVPFQHSIARISPSVPQASTGAPMPVIGAYQNIGSILLWIAFYLAMTKHKHQLTRMAAPAAACLIIGAVVIVGQGRTIYLQLVGLMCIVGLFRPKGLGKFAMVLPILFIILGIITAFEIKIPGRLTDKVSFSFIIAHIEAVGGTAEGDEEGIAGAASGVPQRLGWWTNILEQEWADPVKFITGLGYGRPLTNFSGARGQKVREPHNSFVSVLARLGIVGAISWVWLHVELFKLWRKVFLYYRSVHAKVWIERLLLMLAFVVLVWGEAVGEDALEKPYNIVPYYCFWGVILRLGANIGVARKQVLRSVSTTLA